MPELVEEGCQLVDLCRGQGDNVSVISLPKSPDQKIRSVLLKDSSSKLSPSSVAVSMGNIACLI